MQSTKINKLYNKSFITYELVSDTPFPEGSCWIWSKLKCLVTPLFLGIVAVLYTRFSPRSFIASLDHASDRFELQKPVSALVWDTRQLTSEFMTNQKL